MKKNVILTLTAIMLISMLISPIIAYAGEAQGQALTITISEAYPADLDGDGVEDDVPVTVRISVEPNSEVDVHFMLTLPDGSKITTETFGVYVQGARSKYEIELKDVLSLPGWYVIQGYAQYMGEYAISNPYPFDPEGGTPGPL